MSITRQNYPTLLLAVFVFSIASTTGWSADDPPLPQAEPPGTAKGHGGRYGLRVLSREEAWARLPGATGIAPPLPAWALMLAGPLPRTTAAMLELDGLHRSGNRLEPKLRGMLRWAAADANGCAYSREVAVADLRRARFPEHALSSLGDMSRRSPHERTAMAFARKLMTAAATITDGEFKELLSCFGEEQTVAIVLLLAHASFQDRLLLAIRAPVESDAPPPFTASFVKRQEKPEISAKAAAKPSGLHGTAPFLRDTEWSELSYEALRSGLQKQQGRTERIRIPEPEIVAARIKDDPSAKWQADIHWSRVCYGYQPELTRAWFECFNAIREEAPFDRMLTNLIFWIVTRSERCFY